MPEGFFTLKDVFMNRVKKMVQEGRLTAYVAILLFVKTWLPLLMLGMYNHSNSDDYWMSEGVHFVWEKTGSFLQSFCYGIHNAIWIWKSWDGCFLSMLFTMLSPVAFHEDFYCIVYPLISVTLFLSTGAFTYAIFVRVLKMNRWRWIALWLTFTTILFEFVPFYGEAYYWWPGAVNYTFFFGIFLLVQALCVSFLQRKGKKSCIMACFLGLCVGLGNLMTALVSPVLIFVEAVLTSWIDRKGDSKKRIIGIWLIFFFSLTGLMINVCAPGNLHRGGEDLFSHSAFQAIVEAIKEATFYIKFYHKNIMTVYLVFMAAIILEAMGNIRDDFRFPLPGVFCLITYGLYCALWTPVTYTGVAVYARLGNQLFLGQMLLLFSNLVYFFGWLHKKVFRNRKKWYYNVVIGLSFCALILYYGKYHYLYHSKQALVQVISGNARQFDEQMDARFELYYDDTVKQVYVKPLEYVPGLFFIEDSSFDSLKDYFHKEFIKYEEE